MNKTIKERYIGRKKKNPFRKRLVVKRRKHWDKGDYYDPKYDSRPVEKRLWFKRKKRENKDEFEKGRDKVKELIK